MPVAAASEPSRYTPREETRVNPITFAYERLIEKLAAWVQTRLGVRAAMVLGSRARVDHPADEWSDLDKKLRRGELWTAKACCDSYMKR